MRLVLASNDNLPDLLADSNHSLQGPLASLQQVLIPLYMRALGDNNNDCRAPVLEPPHIFTLL